MSKINLFVASKYISAAMLSGLLSMAAAPAALADDRGDRGDRGDNGQRSDRDDVAALIYCYAKGTDAIGDATTNADPRATGAAIYRKCFTQDAAFRAWFPQQPFDRQAFPTANAFPDTAPAPFIGPDAWSMFVDGVFRGNGYTFTQHMLSNVDVTLQGNTARLTAYLSATHVRSGATIGGVSRCVAVANGTYSGYAVKVNGRWLLNRLDLTLITFNPVFQSGAGC